MLILLLSLPQPASASDFGLTIQPKLSVDVAADRPAEDTVEGYTWLRAWASGDDGQLRWFIEGRGLYIGLIGEDTESVLLAELGETGVSVPAGPAYIEAGHLIERWGRLDLLPIADILNGRDLRAGPLAPLAHSRLPTPMVTAELPWSWGRAELAWSPVPGTNRSSVQGTDWSLIRQGMIDGLVSDLADWDTSALGSEAAQSLAIAAADSLSSDDPWTRWQQASTLSLTGMPPALGRGTDIATRLSAQGARVDASLIGGWLRGRQGTLIASEELVSYLQQERFPGLTDQASLEATLSEPYTVLVPGGLVAGAEVGGSLGAMGLRAEGLWRQEDLVTQQWLAATTSPSLSLGVGLDYARGFWLLTAEGSWRHLQTEATELFLMAPDQYQIAAAVQGRLARERLSLQAGGVYDLTFQEFLVQPAATWRVSDQVEVGASALFLGDRRDTPQTFREALTYTGGPLGYWDDNDCVNVQVSLIR